MRERVLKIKEVTIGTSITLLLGVILIIADSYAVGYNSTRSSVINTCLFIVFILFSITILMNVLLKADTDMNRRNLVK